MSILDREFAGSESFEGIYRVKGRKNGPTIVVKKIGSDKFSFNSDDCAGLGFWNKQANAYEGVFRYHDEVKFDGQEYARGGKFENGVGYHYIEPSADGSGFRVTWQWGLSAENGRGFLEIERVENPAA